ncbi:hypothetical protein [Pseudorhizobium flavum]|nr:hypothetical protein [Pseudorhizobium flavum]
MPVSRSNTFQPLIETAITDRLIIFLRYHGADRTVLPHILGKDRQGHLALSAWQVSGTGQGWRLFHLDQVEELQQTNSRFLLNAPGYNPADPSFTAVLHRV